MCMTYCSIWKVLESLTEISLKNIILKNNFEHWQFAYVLVCVSEKVLIGSVLTPGMKWILTEEMVSLYKYF